MSVGRAEDGLAGASWRLALQTGGLLVLLLAAVAASVLVIVGASQAAASQRLLTTATEHVDSIQDAPAGTVLAISTQGSLSVSPEMPGGLPDVAAIKAVAASRTTIQKDLSLGGRSYTVRTAYSDGRVVQAVLDRHENLEELNRLSLALLLTGGGAVVVVSLLAVWLARRAMLPLALSLERQRRFVADASHELRTPLTLLSTRAQLLRRRLASAGPEHEVQAIGTEVDAIIEDSRSLTALLEDLLVSADARTVDFVPVDLAALADEAVRSFAASPAGAALSIRRSGTDGLLEIQGAPAALRRLLVALLDNAVRFARSTVEVKVTVDHRTAVISVSDDGPGFAEEVKARAFERFATARTQEPEPGATPGTPGPRHYGLGLALVAEVAAQHGGSVVIDGADGAGATQQGAAVTVRLPMTAARRR